MRFRVLLPAAVLLSASLWMLWSPGPTTQLRFDQSRNATWLSHAWWTGQSPSSGRLLVKDDVEAMARRLDAAGINRVYVHAGPVRADGQIDQGPERHLKALQRRSPHLEVLPWLGGLTTQLDLEDPTWRASVVATVEGLQDQGFQGVHLDFEPLRDQHPGYAELLLELRGALGRDFVLSHATRKIGPWGVAAGPLGDWTWSAQTYRDWAALTDETVLMAYDSTLDSQKHYTAFVQHQTEQVAKQVCQEPGHVLRVGVPTFEDSPTSNPNAETLPAALAGVRAALETHPAPCFEGVAVYAEWVTDEQEWQQLREHWAPRPDVVAGR